MERRLCRSTMTSSVGVLYVLKERALLFEGTTETSSAEVGASVDKRTPFLLNCCGRGGEIVVFVAFRQRRWSLSKELSLKLCPFIIRHIPTTQR